MREVSHLLLLRLYASMICARTCLLQASLVPAAAPKALARNLLPSGVRDSNINARGNMADEGFFIDWDGNARSTSDPGGGYLCEADTVARYVAIMTKSGALMHEGTYYKTLADIEKAGIKASLVPGSHPWGSKAEGF
jgi:hypothetical protein